MCLLWQNCQGQLHFRWSSHRLRSQGRRTWAVVQGGGHSRRRVVSAPCPQTRLERSAAPDVCLRRHHRCRRATRKRTQGAALPCRGCGTLAPVCLRRCQPQLELEWRHQVCSLGRHLALDPLRNQRRRPHGWSRSSVATWRGAKPRRSQRSTWQRPVRRYDSPDSLASRPSPSVCHKCSRCARRCWKVACSGRRPGGPGAWSNWREAAARGDIGCRPPKCDKNYNSQEMA